MSQLSSGLVSHDGRPDPTEEHSLFQENLSLVSIFCCGASHPPRGSMKRTGPSPRKPLSSRTHWAPRRFPDIPALSPSARILLLILGWTLVVLGLIGLVLPGLQGVLTLALGAAALSLVSRSMLNALRYVFRPWPKGWQAVLRTRRRVQYWIGRKRS